MNTKELNKRGLLPYRKMKGKSTVISLCWKEVIKQQWHPHRNAYGFEVTPLSQEIWKQEKLLRVTNERFKLRNIGLIRIPPYFNYNWHVDTNRGCSINMLLSHGKSHTFFSERSLSHHGAPHRLHESFSNNGQFIELNYEPNTFYAFNSQKLHCVFNFEKPRYLFSCEFFQQKNELSYERLCEWADKVEI